MAAAKKPTSLRTYAKHRGCSAESVSKAIATGRLVESVIMIGGQPKIADMDVADREWDANTRPRVDQPPAKPKRDSSSDGADVPDYNESRAMREWHAARREAALADMAEIDVAEKREELVSVDEARSYIVDRFTVVKTKILGVPNRIAQRFPSIAAELEPVVEEYLREVLEELVVEPDGDGEGEEEE